MAQMKLLDEKGGGLRRRRRLGIRRGLLRKENREEGSENRAKGEALGDKAENFGLRRDFMAWKGFKGFATGNKDFAFYAMLFELEGNLHSPGNHTHTA